jgi:hypothetical protein
VDPVSIPIFESTGPFVSSDRVEAAKTMEVRSTIAILFFLTVRIFSCALTLRTSLPLLSCDARVSCRCRRPRWGAAFKVVEAGGGAVAAAMLYVEQAVVRTVLGVLVRMSGIVGRTRPKP